MNTKLTLTLENNIIREAKDYAKSNKISLSKLAEFYFKSIAEPTFGVDAKMPPITKELSGIVKYSEKVKAKDILADSLIEKYL